MSAENIIRKLEENDLDEFARVATNAYCGFGVSDEHINERREFFGIVVNHLPDDDLFGLYKNGQLAGGMRLVDYKVQMLSARTSIGGIGGVAVDLTHKKERVAKEMINFACSYFREKGMGMISLYPFRPDFYKNMGFGFGTELRLYRIKPESFPKGPSKENIVLMDGEDKDAIIDCYNRFIDKHHGMFEKTGQSIHMMFLKEKRIVGFKKDGRVSGYMVFSYKAEKSFRSCIFIEEFIYENREALMEMCTFLNSQSDQFERVIIKSTDYNLHLLANNPANGCYENFDSMYTEFCGSAVGLMYRVVNIRKLFEDLKGHDFGGQSCKLKLNIRDNFFKPNDESVVVHFENGKAVIVEDGDYEVETTLNVGEFSSMVMGSINFKNLLEYGMAYISDEKYVSTVNRIFAVEQKPMCNTFF